MDRLQSDCQSELSTRPIVDTSHSSANPSQPPDSSSVLWAPCTVPTEKTPPAATTEKLMTAGVLHVLQALALMQSEEIRQSMTAITGSHCSRQSHCAATPARANAGGELCDPVFMVRVASRPAIFHSPSVPSRGKPMPTSTVPIGPGNFTPSRSLSRHPARALARRLPLSIEHSGSSRDDPV